MDLHAVPPTLAPAPPVPASPKPPRGGIAPQPDPFARRSGGEHNPGAGPAADGGGGGGGMAGGGMPPGASMADAVGTWGHAGHTTTAGGYSNFDRGRGSGAAVAGPTSPGTTPRVDYTECQFCAWQVLKIAEALCTVKENGWIWSSL